MPLFIIEKYNYGIKITHLQILIRQCNVFYFVDCNSDNMITNIILAILYKQ